MHPDRTKRTRVSHGDCVFDVCVDVPRGLRPRLLAAEERMNEIMEAMVRYSNAKKSIPIEWLDEYNELSEYLRNR